MPAIKSGSVIDADTAELIKTEYLNSKQSIRELAEKYDVPFLALKARSNYGKWNTERGKVILKTQMLKAARPFSLSKDSLKAKSDSFVDRMQRNAEATLDLIDSLNVPRDWDRLALREQVMSALQKRGWAAFGLSDSIQERHVTLHLAGEMTPVQGQVGTGPSQEVIEVDCVPQVDTSNTAKPE